MKFTSIWRKRVLVQNFKNRIPGSKIVILLQVQNALCVKYSAFAAYDISKCCKKRRFIIVVPFLCNPMQLTMLFIILVLNQLSFHKSYLPNNIYFNQIQAFPLLPYGKYEFISVKQYCIQTLLYYQLRTGQITTRKSYPNRTAPPELLQTRAHYLRASVPVI